MAATYTYTMPANVTRAPANRYEVAANVAFFLIANGEHCNGRWAGNIRANDQRLLFGVFLGKGRIIVDGLAETVESMVAVCFGADSALAFALRCKSGEVYSGTFSDRAEREAVAAREWFGRDTLARATV